MHSVTRERRRLVWHRGGGSWGRLVLPVRSRRVPTREEGGDSEAEGDLH